MIRNINFFVASFAIFFVLFGSPLSADSVQARCDVYHRGEDRAAQMAACIFTQRQGHITIQRDDGVYYDLIPHGDVPGHYRDQDGRKVIREHDLGDQGLIFRLSEESVYVYWSTAALHPKDENNPTAPFSTKDYDATTLLRCQAVGSSEAASCPAGILRMDDGQASIVIQSPKGEQFTINFMKAYINATNRQAEAKLVGDTWVVTINGEEVYEVPLAAIQGG